MNPRVRIRETAVIEGFACVEEYAIHLAAENEQLRKALQRDRAFYHEKFESIRSAVSQLDSAVQS